MSDVGTWSRRRPDTSRFSKIPRSVGARGMPSGCSSGSFHGVSFTTPARVVVVDIDGDGKHEIAQVTWDGLFTIRRCVGQDLVEIVRIVLPYSPGDWSCAMFDLDGDGTREFLLAGGRPDEKKGFISVYRWEGGKLSLVATDDTLGSYVTHMEFADVDGDGVGELIAGVSFFERTLRLYQYRDRKLRLIEYVQMGSDPEHIRAVGGHVFLHLGPWNSFAALLFDRSVPRMWKPLAHTEERFHANFWLWLDDRSALVSTFRAAKEVAAAPNLLEGGIYRLELANNRIQPLRRVVGPWADGEACGGLARIEVDGAPYVLAGVPPSKLIVFPPDAGAVRSIATEKPPSWLATANMDDDEEPELVFATDDVLHLWGLGKAETAIAAVENREPLRHTRVSAGQDLLDAKLFGLAADLFQRDVKAAPKDARAHFGLGVAFSGQGRYAEAAVHFRSAMQHASDRALALDAAWHLLDALENGRAWREMADVIATLEASFGLDPYHLEQLRRLKAWVLPAASLAPRVHVRDWTDRSLVLISENPFLARVTSQGLVLADSTNRSGSTGFAYMHDGGPLRVRFRFKTQEPGWETGCRLGMFWADHLRSVRRRQFWNGPSLVFHYAAEGSSNHPVRLFFVRLFDRHSADWGTTLWKGKRLFEPTKVYEIEFDMIPKLDRLFVTVRERGQEAQLGGASLHLTFRFDRGLYLLGGVRETLGTIGQTYGSVVWLLEEVEVWSASAPAGIQRPDMISAWDHLLLANGLVVQGRPAEALREYEEAIRRGTREHDLQLLWRAHLFWALAHLRTGRAQEARADVARAMKFEDQQVQRFILSGAGGLSEEERKFLLEAARER